MAFKKDLKQLIKPYYWFNILLSISYVTSKRTNLICKLLFPESDCELDSRETEILFFLIIVVMLRTRKTGSVTMVNYLSSSFVYTKVANLILWFYADVRYGLPYGAIIILTALLLPEPTYSGPENIIYFRGVPTLEDELKKKSTTWFVCLYAAWHPACVNFAPVFAELSSSYGLENFKFGKLDVGSNVMLAGVAYGITGQKFSVQCFVATLRLLLSVSLGMLVGDIFCILALSLMRCYRYPEGAAKYRIQDGPTSRQLPTVLLFKDGQEVMRRPHADSSGKLLKFLFSKDNVKAAFDIDGTYDECKAKLAARASKKTDKAVKAD